MANRLLSLAPQSAAISRSGASADRALERAAIHPVNGNPRPRVTKPTTGSGGAGLQHLASTVIRLSTPSIRMPPASWPARLRRTRLSGRARRRVRARQSWSAPDAGLSATIRRGPARQTSSMPRLVQPLGQRFQIGLQAGQARQFLVEQHRPASMAIWAFCWRIHWRILLMARWLTTQPSCSQLIDGPPSLTGEDFHRWPFCKGVDNGTICPSTLAPRQMAEIGVHRVSKVNGRGAGGQAGAPCPLASSRKWCRQTARSGRRRPGRCGRKSLAPVQQLAQPGDFSS